MTLTRLSRTSQKCDVCWDEALSLIWNLLFWFDTVQPNSSRMDWKWFNKCLFSYEIARGAKIRKKDVACAQVSNISPRNTDKSTHYFWIETVPWNFCIIRLLASKELFASIILILFLSEWLRYEITTHHHTDTFQYGASVPNSKLGSVFSF